MAYATYEFYNTTYQGTAIAEVDFDRLAVKASATIDLLTNERAAAVITADDDAALIAKISMAVCAVAEEMHSIEQAGGGDVIVAERVGSYSVTYGPGGKAAISFAARLSQAAVLYLGSTGLMYRGFTADEYAH